MHKKNEVEKPDLRNLVATFQSWHAIEKYELMIIYDSQHGKYRAFCNDKMCRSLYETPEQAKRRCYGMIIGNAEIQKIEAGEKKVRKRNVQTP